MNGTSTIATITARAGDAGVASSPILNLTHRRRSATLDSVDAKLETPIVTAAREDGQPTTSPTSLQAGPPPTLKSYKQLWYLHGKWYDLAEFAARHPGGATILTMCRGEADPTPVMESYHAFANKEYIAKTMAKYEVQPPQDACEKPVTAVKYTFKPEGFYAVLTRKARDHFKGSESSLGESLTSKVKAEKWWFVRAGLQLAGLSTCWFLAYLNPNSPAWFSVACGFLAAVFMVALGMTAHHDASHYAVVAKNGWWNGFTMRLWCAVGLWDPSMWVYHHVVRHHGYTGDAILDPDTQHAKPFVRKNLVADRKRYFDGFPALLKASETFWALYSILIYVLAPGMFVGQVVSYHIIWNAKGWLWRMRLPKEDVLDRYLWQALLSLSLMSTQLFGYGAPLSMVAYIVGANLTYALCILPDHDTFENAVEHHVDQGELDWGEIQVRHSSDFGASQSTLFGRFFTQFFGGINVQAAHHVFPSVNSTKLAELAPIIKETCAEFNIPYTEHASVGEALLSFIKTVKECMGESGEIKSE